MQEGEGTDARAQEGQMTLPHRRKQHAELAHIRELQQRFPGGTPVATEHVERTIETIALPDGRTGQRITETVVSRATVVPPQLPAPPSRDEFDPLRVAFVGVCLFIAMAMLHSAWGSTHATIWLYWLVFFIVWALLA